MEDPSIHNYSTSNKGNVFADLLLVDELVGWLEAESMSPGRLPTDPPVSASWQNNRHLYTWLSTDDTLNQGKECVLLKNKFVKLFFREFNEFSLAVLIVVI